MEELTFTLLRLGYLVLLWVFVLSAVAVLRRDLGGTKGGAKAPRRSRRAERATVGAVAGAPAGAASPVSAPVQQTAAPAPQRQGPSRLVVTDGALTGTSIPLSSSAILIGRAPGCTLVLDDDYSSSRHARIFPQGGAWFVEDLGSTNGTFIGEHRVTSPVQMGPGTAVRIGRSVVELQG